jgi:hypothetical protein
MSITCCLSSVLSFFKNGTDSLPLGGFLLYYFYLLAMVIGASQLLVFAYGTYQFIDKHFVRQKLDLLQRYAGGKQG